MAHHVDYDYYSNEFGGGSIPEKEFGRLSEIAFQVIYAMCYIKPKGTALLDDDFKTALCYEIELLFEQGGVDTILGMSDASQAGGTESLANYSISAGTTQSNGSSLKMSNGIPISPMSEMILRNLGLMSRWAYAEYSEGK